MDPANVAAEGATALRREAGRLRADLHRFRLDLSDLSGAAPHAARAGAAGESGP